MAFATLEDLSAVAAAYEVTVPADENIAQRALDLAAHDLDRHLGATYALEELSSEQAAALVDANAIQATFRLAQGGSMTLGEDDAIASTGQLTFSLRDPRRLSPEAVERVAGLGLYVRSGTYVQP